jgi:IS5 family transposase
MLTLENFIVTVFCLVDDQMKQLVVNRRLRSRGFAPALADSEVITMEIVGEFLGIDTDKGIWQYFRRHWRHFFPRLADRTTFARQAADLWHLKERMQSSVAHQLGARQDRTHLVDGLPIPLCRFARANFSRLFCGEAAFGHCEAKKEPFFGFRGHLLIDGQGTITAFTLTAANVDEREALFDLLHGVSGLLIGDKGYLSAQLQLTLRADGIDLQTPLRSNMREDRDALFVKMLMAVRRLVETVIGQLSERFHIERVWARDLWHLTSRIARKLLAHTIGVLINVMHGREPLQFDGLVSA